MRPPIRRALAPADQLLLSDRFTLQLHPAVSCDVADFRAVLERAQGAADSEDRYRALREAADAAQREFLPGCCVPACTFCVRAARALFSSMA